MRYQNNGYNDLRWRLSVDALNCTCPDATIEWRPKLKVWDAWVFSVQYPQSLRYVTAKKLRTANLIDACAFVLRQTAWARLCNNPDSVSFLDLSRSIRDDRVTKEG